MHYPTLHNLLSLLLDARQVSGKEMWKASCPVCGKKKQMQVSAGDYRLFVKCWAKRCTEADILSALGLTVEALRFPRDPKPAPDWTRSAADRPPSSVRSLSLRHRRELEKSAISADVIAAMGCWTETDPRVLRELGFSEGQSKCVPCLVFPNHSPDGRVCYQIKPDRPWRDKNGDPVKYMTPEGGGYCLDVLPTILENVMDPARDLWITEGSKKNGAGASHGLTILSVAGVWMWQHKDPETGEYIALPEWACIPLEGRLVWVCYDSDAMHKEEVNQALRVLLAYLQSRDAIIKIVYFPDGEDREKVGLDDYLAAGHTVTELQSLADDILRPMPPVFAQSVVQALQKRTKGYATITAAGATFTERSLKAIDQVMNAVRSIEGQAKGVVDWIYGDAWLEMKKRVAHGELYLTFVARYGQEAANRASGSAHLNRKFPKEQRRDGCIPRWVFQAIATSDAETQQLILDTFEQHGLSRKEIDRIVKMRRGEEPDGAEERRSGSNPQDAGETYIKEFYEWFQSIPVEARPNLLKAFQLKPERMLEAADQIVQEIEAERAAALYQAHAVPERDESDTETEPNPEIFRDLEPQIEIKNAPFSVTKPVSITEESPSVQDAVLEEHPPVSPPLIASPEASGPPAFAVVEQRSLSPSESLSSPSSSAQTSQETEIAAAILEMLQHGGLTPAALVVHEMKGRFSQPETEIVRVVVCLIRDGQVRSLDNERGQGCYQRIFARARPGPAPPTANFPAGSGPPPDDAFTR